MGVHDWFVVLQGVADVSMLPSNKSVTLVFETCRPSCPESSVKQVQQNYVTNVSVVSTDNLNVEILNTDIAQGFWLVNGASTLK